MDFLAAFRFLTTIPLPLKRELTDKNVGGSTAYFPLVGLIIGLILAGLNWLLALFLPQGIVVALLIVALVAITGALHLDGFIDTCDGLAGHKPAEERWRVMRDSRVGAFGVVGAVLLLLVKYVILAAVPRGLLPVTLVMMTVLGRWSMVYSIFVYPYARPEGLGKVFKQETRWQRFMMATVITGILIIAFAALVSLTTFFFIALVLMLLTWLITVVAAEWLRRKFNGLTGDTYGSINEIVEVGFVLIVIIAARNWL